MRTNKLSDRKVAALSKPGYYGDGAGLWLNVRREGSKSWSFRYMIAGKPRYLGLGPVHSVSLSEARRRAREARQLVLDGRDPIDEKRRAAAALAVERLKTMTFRDAVNQFLRTPKIEGFRNDKHRAQWRSTLERYAFPVIGDLPLQEIDTAIVLRTLLPVWKSTPETGSRLRGRIERVFEWARPLGLFTGENPARREALTAHLPAKPNPRHHKALPYADLPKFMSELAKRDSVSARALEFTILTAARTSETIEAKWSEIDLRAKVWTVPAERMKMRKEHRVPLSDRAVAILKTIGSGDPDNYVFINGDTGDPLSNMAMLELLQGMTGEKHTVHGFRSSFRDWAGECTAFPRELIEFALAHKLPDKVEAAYRRETAVEKRRRLMADWARFCEIGAPAEDNVTPLRA
jgi:integrase